MSLYPHEQLSGPSGSYSLGEAKAAVLPFVIQPGAGVDFVSMTVNCPQNYSLRIWVSADALGADGGAFFHMNAPRRPHIIGRTYSEANTIRISDGPKSQEVPSITIVPNETYHINILNLTNETVNFQYGMYDTMSGDPLAA